MPIAVLVLALLAYGYVLLAFPEYRVAALAVGAAAGLALAAHFWLADQGAGRAAPAIPLEQIAITGVSVEPTLRGATISGTVRNDAPQLRLDEVTLALSLRDCPDAATPAEACPVAGQATAIARPDVPPGEERPFRADFIFRPVPALSGEARYEWLLVEARGPR
jgi:hypothetical protein